MYDHAEDDVAEYVFEYEEAITILTSKSGGDCIGHSFGAIAYDTPAPCTGSDADGDGWPDVCDNCPSTPNADQADCNQNGVGDACVPDCDDNGVPDDCDPDCNNNGIPDACDITAETSQDCNENGLADECEPECTGNGVPDDCDIALGTVQDCNHNHVPDLCDIASGTSQDGNTNGVPDECENPSISKVRINEVFANPLNPPNPRPDFVELYGLPGTNLDGLSLLLIQSDQGAASGQGRRIAISGTLPADGLWVLGSAGTPNVDQEVISDIGSGAETFMLVSGFSGSSFFDIDQDNNCSLDWILPVTIGTTIDIVAIADAGTNCYFFPSPRIGPAADGGAPGGIARRFDGHDTNGVEDWCISSKEFIPPDTGRDSYGYNAASPGLSNPSDCDCIAGPPTIVAAHSYKWHGAAGNHGIDLLAPIGGYADAVECRVGGPTYVVVTFNQPVMGFDGLDRTDVTVSSGLVANLFIAGDNLTVQLVGVADATNVTMAFEGIADLSGEACTETLCFGSLLGSATGDPYVNIFDLIQIRNDLNLPVVAGNFRSDLTADGNINIFDLIMCRNVLNHALPGTCSSGGGFAPLGGGEPESGQPGMLVAADTAGAENVSATFAVGDTGPSCLTARFVLHGDGNAVVDLPAQGGRIMVDLVLEADQPIVAFAGRVGIDAANTASVVSAGWSAKANILADLGLGDAAMDTWYETQLFDCSLVGADGQAVPSPTVSQIASASDGAIVLLASDLADLNGPIDIPGPTGAFLSRGTIGGLTQPVVGATSTVVVTLSLDVAKRPGIYHLWFAEGECVSLDGQAGAIAEGVPLEIRVAAD